MKLIAFKRAKHVPAMKDSLHPEFIVEFADTALFPKDFHKPEDGFELLGEDLFLKEYEKNDSYHAEFLDKKRQDELLKIKIEEQMEEQRLTEDRKLKKEFEEFRRWKQSRGK